MKLDLEELQALASRLEKLDKEGMGARLLQLETTYADMLEKFTEMVGLLKQQGPDSARAIAQALGGLKLGENQITVNVPEIKIPAATVSPTKGPAELVITPDRAPNGVAKSYTIKVIK